MHDYEASASKKPSGGFEVEKNMEDNFFQNYCAGCGTQLEYNNEFCSQCGTKTKSMTNNEPIMEFKGRNGRIELYSNFVRLNRKTTMGFLMQGLKGEKDIYFKSITSIQIKKPGLFIGYLQFSILGGNESIKGVINSQSDENTISFVSKDKYNKSLEIKKYIEEKINSVNPEIKSSADEIEKLYSLMEKGIITEGEFEGRKKELLSK